MPDTPRLLFYWGRMEDTSILSMPREQWHDLVGHLGEPIAFDVRSSPMAGVTRSASVVAAVAHEFSNTTARVSIFRDDPTDAPFRINLDHYKVWTDLSANSALSGMITAASTEYNDNMKRAIKDHVYFVKEKPGPDHWLPTLPASISLVLKSS